MLVLLVAFAAIMGKQILLILKTTLLPHITDGEAEMLCRYLPEIKPKVMKFQG